MMRPPAVFAASYATSPRGARGLFGFTPRMVGVKPPATPGDVYPPAAQGDFRLAIHRLCSGQACRTPKRLAPRTANNTRPPRWAANIERRAPRTPKRLRRERQTTPAHQTGG